MTAIAFYRNLALLDTNKHRQLRFKPFDDIRFAAATQTSLLAASEFPDCAVEYPIVFTTTQDGPAAIALFGLRPNENLFVTAEGKWEAHYVPAFLRRYPFIPTTAADGTVMVAIDEDCANLGREEGELLIDADGKSTPYLNDLVKFIESVHADYGRAATFAKTLAERGLLREMHAEVKLDNGQQMTITGFQVVDEAKLVELSNADLAAMARSGELALIHAHLLSFRNLQKLVRRTAHRPAPAAAAETPAEATRH